mmetsp:Transcript_16332/g.23951  ORF Transcript_16332/g.23951 Transcript_16332/m.23951 type:complete len:320 (-) Transcript_16332:460-1419(-)|eukprot:CAMPEP_0195520718 /NCGR_PEP_ID=MMETSP0794_2-20130614/17481_1 /TAXON_ID=515487 /ORGANISM="Stephanopyxis turris, Strain CCMP 815" /LENGTH=319 /DNA_ID=CAMNT_0040650137 /DNA_START=135 /DNA_END=1094 /DNA_ORIENTATION=+
MGQVFCAPKESFHTTYSMGETLGSGAFSIVKEGLHKKTGEKYAIKVVKRAQLSADEEVALQEEIGILADLCHANILYLYDSFAETKFYYLVTELLLGGELFDRIVKKETYNEKEARDVCKTLFLALAYCHSNNVCHRDLKPENLLLMSDSDTDIKIADFGFARRFDPAQKNYLTTQCGTPGYVAPEILKGVPYGTGVDMWSLGVIVFILLGGYQPFEGNTQKELFRAIKTGSFEFIPEFWDNISNGAKYLIKSLLTVDPKKRLSAQDALQNEWISETGSVLMEKNLGKNLEELKKFNARRKFKAGVHAVLLTNKLKITN